MESFYDRVKNLKRPEKKSSYDLYVYNLGNVYTFNFGSKLDVQKKLNEFKKNWRKPIIPHEQIEVLDKDYEEANAAYDRLYAAIVTEFLQELRAEHSDIPAKAYDILYSRAWQQGHSSGYDEVASYMDDLAELYRELKDAFSATEVDPNQDVKELIQSNKFVRAVKLYRQRYNLSLKEAKYACDEMKERLSK